jgi:Arc/MetJ-type ribon-helix-helix transcriptional regulator
MNKSAQTTRTLNISLPAKLVTEIDKAAKGEFASRSDYIRDSILRKLRSTQERWEEVADFTAAKKGGVDIDELLKRL